MGFENISQEEKITSTATPEERVSILHEAVNDNESLEPIEEEVHLQLADPKEEELIAEVTALREATGKLEEVYGMVEAVAPEGRRVNISEMHFSRSDRDFIAKEFSSYGSLSKEELLAWQEELFSQIQSIESQSFLQRTLLSAKKNRLFHIHQVVEEVLMVIDKK